MEPPRRQGRQEDAKKKKNIILRLCVFLASLASWRFVSSPPIPSDCEIIRTGGKDARTIAFPQRFSRPPLLSPPQRAATMKRRNVGCPAPRPKGETAMLRQLTLAPLALLGLTAAAAP